MIYFKTMITRELHDFQPHTPKSLLNDIKRPQRGQIVLFMSSIVG